MRQKKNTPRLLFILKHREQSNDPTCWNYSEGGGALSSGLYNSVRFLVDVLLENGVEAKLVHVVDNNSIDREVTRFRPTHVIIEAFWVVPEKFDILKKIHPKVSWIVRNHSKSEFLASEGIAFGWGIEYLRRNIELACNSPEECSDWIKIAKAHGLDVSLITYLPNYYPVVPKDTWELFDHYRSSSFRRTGYIDIGCFGAIRPLKNHVNQAIAAIDFADDIGANLRFHINDNRIEGMAAPIHKNLVSIFGGNNKHRLVSHTWLEHHEFKKLVKRMEIVSQVTFSETFNIVAADAVSEGVPIVGSNQIPWLPKDMAVDPNNVETISRMYRRVWSRMPWSYDVAMQRKSLSQYVQLSKQIWLDRFGS